MPAIPYSLERSRRRRQAFVHYLFLVSVAVLLRRSFAEDWLQWGGPHGDFTVDTKGIAESWPPEGVALQR